MKVNKEEMFGMYAALKAYLERDHEKEWQEWLGKLGMDGNGGVARMSPLQGHDEHAAASRCTACAWWMRLRLLRA